MGRWRLRKACSRGCWVHSHPQHRMCVLPIDLAPCRSPWALCMLFRCDEQPCSQWWSSQNSILIRLRGKWHHRLVVALELTLDLHCRLARAVMWDNKCLLIRCESWYYGQWRDVYALDPAKGCCPVFRRRCFTLYIFETFFAPPSFSRLLVSTIDMCLFHRNLI